MYKHKTWNGEDIDLPVGKIVCIGLNYAKHVAEMQEMLGVGGKPEEPVLFMKPNTTLVSLANPVKLPTGFGEVHHETELAILIKDRLTNVEPEHTLDAVFGYGVALDLTLRDIQIGLKKKGLPWEKSKAFDGACPVSGFVAAEKIENPQNIELKLTVNGDVRQYGNTSEMLFKIPQLLSAMSKFFTLNPGDIVLTGTPESVGALKGGDKLIIEFNNLVIEQSCIS